MREISKKGTTLIGLPIEILQSICAHLCLHCQTPHAADAPYSRVHTALLDQRALSSLSRTCGHLRTIAQPVLFHLYLSDSSYCVPKEHQLVFGLHDAIDEGVFRADLFNVRYHFRERRRAALFLRTLLERDHLAACVHALTLYQAPWSPSVLIDQRGDIEVSRLRKTETPLVVDVITQGTQRVLDGCLGGHLAISRGKLNDSLERVQELIILLSATSLEQLYIERTMFLDELVNMQYDWRGWSYPLPRLKYLAFLGQRVQDASTYYYKEACGLIASAPNLCSLVLPDCQGSSEPWIAQQFKNVPWDISLEFLSKLSVSGIRRNHLRTILLGCPVLEDLEYCREDTGFDVDILCPEEDLSAVKGTLRRLCYSIHQDDLDRSSENELEILDEDYYPSWTVMSGLKILEIQRLLLWGTADDVLGVEVGQDLNHDEHEEVEIGPTSEVHLQDYGQGSDQQTVVASCSQETFKMQMTTPEYFMSRLPQSLETLCIGRIICWPAMYRDAAALARVATHRFPHLRQLILEVCGYWPSQGEIEDLICVFNNANITCQVLPREDGKSGRPCHVFPPENLA